MRHRYTLGIAALTLAIAVGLVSSGDAQGPVVLRSSSGVEVGTSSNPLRINPTGSTTQPVSGTVTANAGSGNFTVTQGTAANLNATVVQGTAANLNATVVGTGTFATQAAQSGTWTVQPGNTANATAWLVTGTGGTFPATQSGTWTVQPGNTANTTAWLMKLADPCSSIATTAVPFSISSATTTQLIAASGSNKNYICSINLLAAGADNVALVEDDTSACASPTAGMAGGTTAASGWNFAANGGMAYGDGGHAVFITAATNRYTCLITSAAVQLSGTITYVQAP